ncbi:MAG: hypothetical protein JW915_09160 [Chitinispirillaceae bacterium]|nr:hypothetical protein [Chitinispirillaceae bacterium]
MKIFISGSISIKTLNKQVLERLNNIMDKEYQILIGDADGVDKNIQTELKNKNYKNVNVYCSGETCRNNVGKWATIHIEVPPKVNGRKFYMLKDEQMAEDADYGFLIWDGKSAGTINNLANLVKGGKTGIVYFSKMESFFTVKDKLTFEELLRKCNPEDLQKIEQKTGLKKKLSQEPELLQQVLALPSYPADIPFENSKDFIPESLLVNESPEISYPNNQKKSILDFLNNNLVNDLYKMVQNGMDYYAFILLCSGLELLGSFFDQKELGAIGVSSSRITCAIDNLFSDNYKNSKIKNAIKGIRNSLIHQFRPTGDIALTSETTSNCPRKYHLNKGLSPDDKRIIFVIERFVDDFKYAITKLINEKDGKLKPVINTDRFESEFIFVQTVKIESDVITTSGGLPYKVINSITV